MRKAVWVALVLMLVAGAAAAVRYMARPDAPRGPVPSGNELTAPGSEPVTLKLLFPLDEPKDQAQVTKAVEEKLAQDGLPLKLEFTFVPFDQYWNRVWVNAASGEDYDLALTSYSNLSDMVSKKVLAPLDSALQAYGPDILAHTPDYALQGVTINGHIYAIPRVMPIAEHESFVQIRGDLRKKYGLPEIKTVGDMDRYLEAIAENEPEMIPYFYDTGRFLLREYGDVAFLAGNYLNAPVYIDPADPELEVKNTYESVFFRKIMEKLHEWQRKGYIPYGPEGTPEIPDPEKALYEGKIAATWSVVLKQAERIDSFKEKLPLAELENVYLHPERPKYMFTAADNMLSVFSTSRHVNEAVALINWVRKSQENYDLFTYGVKNVNYKLVGDDAISYDEVHPTKRFMSIQWAWNDIRYFRFSKYLSEPYKKELRNWNKDAVASPTLGFMPDLTPIKSEMAQVNVIVSEYLALLYDEKVDWDTTMARFQAKLKNAGMEHVKAEIQRQFDEFRSRNGR